jgi:hypothetical protein
MDLVSASAAEGNPRVLIGAALGLAIVLLSGPTSRLFGRFNRALGQRPASAIAPLLNKKRQDATRNWLREGGDAGPIRLVLVVGGVVFIVASALLFLGVVS